VPKDLFHRCGVEHVAHSLSSPRNAYGVQVAAGVKPIADLEVRLTSDGFIGHRVCDICGFPSIGNEVITILALIRTDIPDLRFSRDGEIGVADGSILSYLRAEPGMTLVAYSPLLNGAYTRPDKELDRAYDHPGTRARLEALDQVVRETGATANQVVLAWLIGGELPVVPLIGASSVAQLDESLAAVDLQLSSEQRQLLDAAD
jgi:hypothetical protein